MTIAAAVSRSVAIVRNVVVNEGDQKQNVAGYRRAEVANVCACNVGGPWLTGQRFA